MNYGHLLLIINLLAFGIAFLSYLFHEILRDSRYLKLGRWFFYAGIGLNLAVLAYLLSAIFNHQFEYSFVYQYSSRDLPDYYLFSTLWAGQAGTFLMWSFFSGLYGLVLIRQNSKYTNKAMVVVLSVLVILFVLTLVVNPFEYIWHSQPGNFMHGQTPVDGQGLNPLLQDYWMVIHPPILFVGYSSTLIPFALIIARLWIGCQEKDFTAVAQPWTLFNLSILGTGIILGGYWAYTTLGWGGYWAWDPVENASLVPWLIMLVYGHGIILEKNRSAMVRSNLFFGTLPFITMLYGSFLTRSGVLADFSVHSFVDQGLNVFLAAFVVLYLVIFSAALVFRITRFRGEKLGNLLWIQETFISYGMLIVSILALLVVAGTSSPLLTRLVYANPANVSTEYYNYIGLVTGFIMLGLLLAIPFLQWRKEVTKDKIMRPFTVTVITGLVITTVVSVFYLDKWETIALFLVAVLALIANGYIIGRRFAKSAGKIGGFWAHTGFALMVIGFILTTYYGASTRLALPENAPRSGLGYTFEFAGMELGARGQDKAVIKVDGNGDSYVAKPKFYYSDYTRSYMQTPHVQNYLSHDFYIAPLQLVKGEEYPPGKRFEINKGDSVSYGGDWIAFKAFSMGRDSVSNVTALAELFYHGANGKSFLQPGIRVIGGKREYIVDSTRTGLYFTVGGMSVNDQSIILYVSTPAERQNRPASYLIIEVSEKPFILVLWVGTIVLIFGITLALLNRRKKEDFTSATLTLKQN
jgi:cytochrome c-type biogenesis protein CcmF